ncbi:FYVE, RhoGEF and PH domain-containing protein 1-like [Antedon mediterranea]|uniref:FYVE, RhoGEF and PH domain-containing protein 1-like n=1 Tax=Antedon mediterranea TaxID=105859 RepID=UPI003AF880DC
MCMRCALDFGLTRRRHHCRACGVVVCSRCSNQQAELAYDSNKPGRVCRKCYVKLKGIDAESPLSPEEKKLSFTEEDTLFGSTMFIQQKSGWNKLWAVVTAEDLHLVRAPKDVRAVVSIPLSFYNISDIDSGDVIDRPFAFKLIEKSGKNIYYLSTECKELKKKWMAYLQEGIPDDSGRACPHDDR